MVDMEWNALARTAALLAALALLHCGSVPEEDSPKGARVADWVTVAADGAPTARREAAMVALGGKGYLLGGRGVKPVEEFDPQTRTWRQLGPTPLEIHHFQPVVFRDRTWVMTAMTGRYPKETPLETVYVFDPSGDEWEKGPAVPASRRRGGAGTAVYDGKIYLACGIMDGHTSGTVAWFDEFDPATGEWTQLPDAPRARDHFSAVVKDGQLYLVGGRNTSYHEPDNFTAFFDEVVPEVDGYDFSTGAWSTLPAKLPVPTAAAGLAALDGSIYHFGGETGQDLAHSDALRLDTATGEWHPAGSLVTGRHGAGTAGLDGRIHVAAGSGGRGGGSELDSTEVLDAGL